MSDKPSKKDDHSDPVPSGDEQATEVPPLPKQTHEELARAFYLAYETAKANFARTQEWNKLDSVLQQLKQMPDVVHIVDDDDEVNEVNNVSQCDSLLDSYQSDSSTSTVTNNPQEEQEKGDVTTPPEKDLNLPPPPEINEDLWESVQLYEMQMSAKKHLSKNVDADPLCGGVNPINVPHNVEIQPPHELDQNGNELQGSDESGEDAENDEQPPTVEQGPRVLREIDTSKERGDSPPLPPPPAIFRDVYEDRIVEEAADRLGMNLKSPIALPGKEMMITADNVVECAFQEAISIVEKKLEMSVELSSQANVPMNSCLDANCGELEEALDQPRVQPWDQDVDELCQRCAQIHIHENYVGDVDRIPRNVFQVEFSDFEELETPLEVVAEGVTEEVAKTDPKIQASIEEESEDGEDGSCSRKYLVETASVSEDDTLDEKLECVELSELSESESSSLMMMVKVVEELTAQELKDSEGHGAEKLENKWTEIPEPQKWEYFAQDNKIMGVVMEENADENCHNIAEENSLEEALKVVDDDVCGPKVIDDFQKSQDIGQKVCQPLEEWKMSHINKSVIVEHEKGDDWDEECLDSPRKSSSDQERPHFFSKRVNLDSIKLDEDIVPKFQEPKDINITINAQCIFSGNVVPSLHCGSGIGDTDLSSVLEDKGDRAFDKGSVQSSSLSQSGEDEEEMGDEGKITSYLSATITAITDYESNSSDENQKVESREEQVLQDFRTCPNAVPPQIWKFVDEGHDRKSFTDVEVIGVSRTPAGPDSTGELVQLISKIQVCLDTTTAPTTTTTTTTPGWETESSDSESDSETEQELYKLYRMPRTLEKENESEANPAHSQPPVDPTRPLFSQSWTDMMKEDSFSNYWDEKPIHSSETPNNRKKMGKGNKRHQKEKKRSSLKTIGTILTSPFRIIYNFFRKK